MECMRGCCCVFNVFAWSFCDLACDVVLCEWCCRCSGVLVVVVFVLFECACCLGCIV